MAKEVEQVVADSGEGVVAAVPGSEGAEIKVEPQAGAIEGTPADTTEGQGEPPAWVRQRISQASRRAQEAERGYQRAQGEIDYLKRQLASLTGAQSTPTKNADHEELRALIDEVYPELRETRSRQDEIAELRDTVDFLSKYIWSSRATGVTDKVFERAKGGFKRDLNNEARDVLQLAFASFVQSDQDRADRYLSGDDAVVDEFYELMEKGGFFMASPQPTVKPAVKVAGKVAKLPATGSTGGKILPGASTPDNSDKSMDELVNDAWEMLQRVQ